MQRREATASTPLGLLRSPFYLPRTRMLLWVALPPRSLLRGDPDPCLYKVSQRGCPSWWIEWMVGPLGDSTNTPPPTSGVQLQDLVPGCTNITPLLLVCMHSPWTQLQWQRMPLAFCNSWVGFPLSLVQHRYKLSPQRPYMSSRHLCSILAPMWYSLLATLQVFLGFHQALLPTL